MGSSIVNIPAQTWVRVSGNEFKGFIRHKGGGSVIYVESALEPVALPAATMETTRAGDCFAYFGLFDGIPMWAYAPHEDAEIVKTPVLDEPKLAGVGVIYDPSDLSTLFQDSAGTIPVTGPEQPVGLMLDKSKGLVRGVELIENGDFSDGTTGWRSSGGAVLDVTDGVLTVSGAVDYVKHGYQLEPLTAGKTYYIAYDASPGARIEVREHFANGDAIGGVDVTATTKTLIVRPAVTGTYSIRLYPWGGTSATFSTISVRELPGNHAFQATNTKRPILKEEGGHYYLKSDGVDDFMETAPIDWGGADKMTVIAGVHKLDDSASKSLIESSSNSTSTAGTFGMFAPAADGASYQYISGGSIPSVEASAGVGEYPAPVASVVSGVSDISSDSVVIRVDGVQKANNTSDQGVGSYASEPLYLFMRGGVSLPSNGHFCGLVIDGSKQTPEFIDTYERYLAEKTGVLL